MKIQWNTFLIIFLQALVAPCLHAQIKNIGINDNDFSKEYYSIPFIDLDKDTSIQAIVDRESGQYLGHPSTVLLNDGNTMYCAYPKGHGRGAIIMKKSTDGGITWSNRLTTPKNWQTSKEVPTLFQVEDEEGEKRIIMFSGRYPVRMAISENNGTSWTKLKKIGDWGGLVIMSDLIALNTGKGHYMAVFHDDQRYFTKDAAQEKSEELVKCNMPEFILYKTFSYDGGLTWSFPEAIFKSQIIHLCEGGMVRSPDGKEIAMLLRENSNRMNSHIIFSNDEGKTWSLPRQLPNSLSGDRHQAIYTPDGRLFVAFRDRSPAFNRFQELKQECKNCDEKQLYLKAGPISPTHGDWVAWVGTFEDLKNGNEGQYRIRFKDNCVKNDCGYTGLEILPDGTIVAISYGHWEKNEKPYILSIRMTINYLDKIVDQKPKN